MRPGPRHGITVRNIRKTGRPQWRQHVEQHGTIGSECRFKPQLTIERGAYLRRIQLDPFHPARCQRVDGVLHQPARETAPAVRGISEQHADPRQPAFITDRCGSRRQYAIALHSEARLRRQPQQIAPIGLRLVPARGLL
jgi:hypothetical protein